MAPVYTFPNDDGNNNSNNNNNQRHEWTVDLLLQYHKLSFKPVPLSLNHKPIVDWTFIYENQEYWSDEKSIAECLKFPNVVTAIGKTHVKDSVGDLYLNGFDCDDEPVYEIIITSIDKISNPLLKSKLLDLYSKYGTHQATTIVSLLDFLKEITIVVKTRKPYPTPTQSYQGLQTWICT